ncbi:hemerythrin [Prauserella marina]|uniref:Deazaflavin-dependent oxidoreductase, nitroreductase family n=1 Tax=Prauserella marina TaxID=530584 RepID=A0A222VZI7_9PSEU|nr:nitroreductase/quinone reductase family protein [Prauserella marina]ASR39212.1 hemerythrin [Prauserella marina]PWV84489.1 deazaflavin-dependent oxidoreductase (nitroreductase family) [Prauserella marina]SDC21195.1 deazaflavin-dependent oxidoreductase, nitroreductase family [Prauserella marina]
MTQGELESFERQLIAEFRENEGKMSGMFAGATLCVLTTIGAKTGLRREKPLAYLEIDGHALVVASAGGADRDPGWYHNILATPMVTVETGTDTYRAIATPAKGAERDRLFAAVVEHSPGFADYQATTERVIPVVTLRRIGGDGEERVRGLGDFLAEGHEWLRDGLTSVRARLSATIEGEASVSAASGPSLARQLRAHCLDFCGALHQHHEGEDRGAFPILARRYPELAPVLDRLGEEHRVVSALRERIEALVAAEGSADPVRLRDELDQLAAELESHFAYEERTIAEALNTLGPAPGIP